MLKDPRLTLFCFVQIMFTLAEYIPIDFLPDAMVKEHGISPINAGSIITMYGGATIAGRLISGVITNYFENSAVLYTLICMCVMGNCCIGMAVSTSYWQFMVCACIYGLFVGKMFVLLPISLVDMFGIESLKDSFGVIMFFSAVSTLLGAPMAGWLKVLCGTYDLAFIVASDCYCMGGIVTFLLLWIQNRKRKQYTSCH